MALHLEWVGIAEGTVIDSRGAATLVGVNQNVLTPQTVPFAWAVSIFMLLTEETDSPSDAQDSSGLATLNLLGPDDSVLSSTTQTVKVQRKYPDIPATMALAAQVVIAIQNFGRYTIIASLKSSDGTEEVSKKYMYVLPPQK